MARIRPAAVAGHFYPADATQLRQTLDDFLNEQSIATGDATPNFPKALIVPHAGYIYSGGVAAKAYAKLAPFRHTIKRVVLLGPCHRVPVGGLALSSADFFETPLGRIPLDKELVRSLSRLPQVFTFDDTHTEEHSLEVHLPFLQTLLSDFTIVPLIVGQASPAEVSEALNLIWGGEETLIIISTDLSHYLDYDQCQSLDNQTVQAIENFDINAIKNQQACGRIPLKGLLETAQARSMSIETLDVKNSGDTAGPKDRVVGYGSWILSGGQKPSEHEAFSFKMKAILARYGHSLLQVGAASIKRGISHQSPVKLDLNSFPDSLKEEAACFVTIEKFGQLRGCIGSLQAHQPLAMDVAENAFKAGFKDPRFPPLEKDELEQLSLHISILSPAFEMTCASETDLLEQIRIHKDGLIIQDLGRRAVFLPSVWEKIPDKSNFLAQLRLKAGLDAHHWSDTFKAWRFITEGIHSEKLDAPAKLWQE